jgi:alpha-beta hydrolase superfamily lysophospholipase
MDRKATYTGSQFIVISSAILIFSLILLAKGYLVGAILTVIIWSYLIVIELLTNRYLAGPFTRKAALEDENWIKINTTRNGFPVNGRLRLQEGKSALMICLHGWSSSTARMNHIMSNFHDMGMHTIALEYRNHGDGGETKEWTSLKIVEDLDQLMADCIDRELVSEVYLYGHSMGSFVILAASKVCDDSWWNQSVKGAVLESPMTSYPEVFRGLTSSYSILRLPLKRKLMRAWKIIHPETTTFKWNDTQLPSWGVPNCPLLIVQAPNDNVLSPLHFELLMDTLGGRQDVESHIVEGLTHSRSAVNEDRDELVESWLRKQLTLHS